MSDEDSPQPITTVLNQLMASVSSLGKGQRNRDQGFDFRGIDDVINAVGPKLRQYGVVPTPLLEDVGYRDVRTTKDKPARECTVRVRYRFWGPAGDYLDTVAPGESLDSGDKGTAKAMSVAYRIALLQMLALPTDDTDPDHETYQRVEQRERTPGGLRSEIALLGKQKGYSTDTIAADFTRVMNGADIVQADIATLAEYKQRLEGYKPAGES